MPELLWKKQDCGDAIVQGHNLPQGLRAQEGQREREGADDKPLTAAFHLTEMVICRLMACCACAVVQWCSFRAIPSNATVGLLPCLMREAATT